MGVLHRIPPALLVTALVGTSAHLGAVAQCNSGFK